MTNPSKFDFEGVDEDLAFSGWSRGPYPNGPTWSIAYAHSGTHSGKMKQGVAQTYIYKHDFSGGNIVIASCWLLVHAVGSSNSHAWVFTLQSGGTEYVAGQFYLAADRYIYYQMNKGHPEAHNTGIQFTLNTWFRLTQILHPNTQIIDYYVNDVYIASHAYWSAFAVNVDGFCIEGLGDSDGWEWYFDDVRIAYPNEITEWIAEYLETEWDDTSFSKPASFSTEKLPGNYHDCVKVWKMYEDEVDKCPGYIRMRSAIWIFVSSRSEGAGEYVRSLLKSYAFNAPYPNIKVDRIGFFNNFYESQLTFEIYYNEART